MRKVILYIATSLDGYIAKTNGDTNWLHNEEYTIENEDYGYSKLLESIDTCLMGNKTYQQIKSFDMPYPYADKTNYIFSRDNTLDDNEDGNFINENLIAFVQDLKKKEGKDIWLIGGGEINTLFLKNNLIDELILTLAPVVLGEGIKLFPGLDASPNLKVVQSQTFKNGMVQLKCKLN